MNIKRLLAILLVVTMLTAMFAACGQPQNSTPQGTVENTGGEFRK